MLERGTAELSWKLSGRERHLVRRRKMCAFGRLCTVATCLRSIGLVARSLRDITAGCHWHSDWVWTCSSSADLPQPAYSLSRAMLCRRRSGPEVRAVTPGGGRSSEAMLVMVGGVVAVSGATSMFAGAWWPGGCSGEGAAWASCSFFAGGDAAGEFGRSEVEGGSWSFFLFVADRVVGPVGRGDGSGTG